MVRNSRGLRAAAIFIYQNNRLKVFIKGRLKGLRPFKNYTSPSPLKERDTKGKSKRGSASLI